MVVLEALTPATVYALRNPPQKFSEFCFTLLLFFFYHTFFLLPVLTKCGYKFGSPQNAEWVLVPCCLCTFFFNQSCFSSTQFSIHIFGYSTHCLFNNSQYSCPSFFMPQCGYRIALLKVPLSLVLCNIHIF